MASRRTTSSTYAQAMVVGVIIFAAGLATGRYSCQPETDAPKNNEPVIIRADPLQREVPPVPTLAPVPTAVAPPAPVAPPPPQRVPELEDPFEEVESVPDEAPLSSEEQGTLVAIAIGGQCTFYVDGAKQSTSSSIRLEVAVGRHTVRCVPPPGGSPPLVSKQTAEVTRSKPGIVSFRIQ